MSTSQRLIALACALGATVLAASPGAAAITAAPGWAAHSIPTPGTVQGGVIRSGDVILVGQGAFGAGLEPAVDPLPVAGPERSWSLRAVEAR